MSKQIKNNTKNRQLKTTSTSHPQPIIISWTNPSSNNQKELLDQHHIKQEDELQIHSQVIQEVPHPSFSESNKSSSADESTSISKKPEEVMKKFVKILPKNGNDTNSQRVKEDYLRMPKRKYSKRHSKSPLDLIQELSGSEVPKKKEKPKEKEVKIFRVKNVPILQPVEILTRPLKIAVKKVANGEQMEMMDEILIKKEEEYGVITEVKAVDLDLKTSNNNLELPVIKKESVEDVAVKVTNIDLKLDIKTEPIGIEGSSVSTTVKKVNMTKYSVAEAKSPTENVKLSNINFIKTTSPSGTIKLTTVPSNRPKSLKNSSENGKLKTTPGGKVKLPKLAPKPATLDQVSTRNIKLLPIPSVSFNLGPAVVSFGSAVANPIQNIYLLPKTTNLIPETTNPAVTHLKNVAFPSESPQTDDDDDDEERLVIKEEDELHITDVHDQNNEISSINFYNSQPSTSSKRPSTSTEQSKPPKKQKLQSEPQAVKIIPYIPKVKPPSRKSSTSSESSASTSHPFQCKLCMNVFKRKIDLIHHVKSHSDAKYQCQRCGMKFKFVGYFQKHKCIACDICDKTFVLKQLLRNHQRNVHGMEMSMYTCDICGKSLRYRHGILYHMSKVHMKFLEAKFGCDICGKRFKLKESIRLHMKNHEMEIECKICSKKVKQVNLNIHMKSVHVTARNFQCTQCSMTFKTRECLKSHIRTHEKSFECTECGKKFANKSHLKEHGEWHKNPEAFKCTICNKSFAQRYCLKAHMKLHESGHNFTKFKCTLCPYSTDNAENLKKHELKHKRQEESQELRKNWLQCEKCPMKMKNKLKLATHYWKKHSEVMPK